MIRATNLLLLLYTVAKINDITVPLGEFTETCGASILHAKGLRSLGVYSSKECKGDVCLVASSAKSN